MAGVCGVLDDAACLSQAPFRGDVLEGWELEGLAVVDEANTRRDATGRDALDGVLVAFEEDPGRHAEFLQPP